MTSSTLFTHIDSLVTLSPVVATYPQRRLTHQDLGVVRDAAMLVNSKGVIEWAGPLKESPSKDLHRKRPSRKKLDAHTVLPGFVDAHTHLIFAGTRAGEFRERAAGKSYQEIAAAGGGILTTVKATRKASEKELLKLALDRAQKSMSYGATTLEVKSGYGLSDPDEKKMLRVATQLSKKCTASIIRTYLGAHAFPPEISREDYVKRVAHNIATLYKEGLYDHLDMFTEENYFSLEDSQLFIQEAKKSNIPFKIHADELSPLGGVRLGVREGALSVDHCLHYLGGREPKEVLSEFRNGTTIPVFLPGTAFFLKLAYANPLPLLEGGVRVALATDFNPGSCMSQNMAFMMTLGVLYMKMNVEETLVGTTLHGAKALGLLDRGALVAGMRADFQILRAPYEQLAYEFATSHLDALFIKGAQVI